MSREQDISYKRFRSGGIPTKKENILRLYEEGVNEREIAWLTASTKKYVLLCLRKQVGHILEKEEADEG